MSATENTKDGIVEATEKPVEAIGIGAFRRSRPTPTAAMHKDLQNDALNDSVAHFHSILNAKTPPPEPESSATEETKAPTATNSGEVGETPPSSISTLRNMAAQANHAGAALRMKKPAKPNKAEGSEGTKEFPIDGSKYNFAWPMKLQSDVEAFQFKLKQDGRRVTMRDLLVLGLTEVLGMSKDTLKKKMEEALKGYGTL